MPRGLILAWIGVAWLAGLAFGWLTSVGGRIEIVEALCAVVLTMILGVFAVLAVYGSRGPQEQ